MYIFNPWKIFCNPSFHEVFCKTTIIQAVKKMEWIENRKYDNIQTKMLGFRLCVVVSVWVYVGVCVCVYVL